MNWLSPQLKLPEPGMSCILLSPAGDVVLGPFEWRAGTATTPSAWFADDGDEELVIPPGDVGWWMPFVEPQRVVHGT